MRVAALALAALLLLPTALAHLPHIRGVIQPTESDRIPEVAINGTAAHVTLVDSADRFRNLVTYDVNPARMSVAIEERLNPSIADHDAIHARFQIDRLLLYHDANGDGVWEPNTDSVLKSWRFVNYRWASDGVRLVRVGGLSGVDDVFWNGTLGGAPNVTLEMVAAGRAVSDEGADARQQDVLLYLTMPSLPPRPLGSLYALEGSVTTSTSAAVSTEFLDNVTLAAQVDEGPRRAFLDWGGQVLADGRDGNVTFDLDAPTLASGEHVSAARWSLPTLDTGFRMVMVAAVETAPTPTKLVPDASLPAAAVALAALALARRRR